VSIGGKTAQLAVHSQGRGKRRQKRMKEQGVPDTRVFYVIKGPVSETPGHAAQYHQYNNCNCITFDFHITSSLIKTSP
jgi:hypothetical protein